MMCEFDGMNFDLGWFDRWELLKWESGGLECINPNEKCSSRGATQ